MGNSIETIKEAALPILKEEGVLRSSLFGSFSRGEARTDSDVDFLIELPKGKSLFDIARLKVRLEDALGRKVDLVEYHCIRPFLRSGILSDSVALF